MLLGMAGAAGVGGEARAQPGTSREDARSRYREAQRLMETQRWREALPLLREVARAAETASVLYSIALCEENLGLWREAIEDYRAALDRANDPVRDPGLKPAARKIVQNESRRNLEVLGEKMPSMRVDRLPESDVEVVYKLDGRPISPDELLQGVRVNVGDHHVRAEAAGKRPLDVAFRAEERAQTVVALANRLDPLEEKRAPPVLPAAAPPRTEPRPGAWRTPAGWAGVGIGATLLGAGVVASLRVDGIGKTQNDDRALQHYGSLALMDGYGGRCDAADEGVSFEGRNVASRERVHRLCSAQGALRPLQYVFYGTGALFAVVGAYLLLSAEPRTIKVSNEPGATKVWVLPGLGPAPLGGSVGGVF